jgi:phosphomevalonate kinase
MSFPLALEAHRKAQPLGSGIDVAASVHGGVVRCRLRPHGALDIAPFTLPAGLVLEVFACPTAASTGGLVEKVRNLREKDAGTYRRLLESASNGARNAASARNADDFVSALAVQTDALTTLGRHAGAAIVIDEVAELRSLAESEGATFGPSGAGGGDIALWAGLAPPSDVFCARAATHRLEPLGLTIGARGLHVA